MALIPGSAALAQDGQSTEPPEEFRQDPPPSTAPAADAPAPQPTQTNPPAAPRVAQPPAPPAREQAVGGQQPLPPSPGQPVPFTFNFQDGVDLTTLVDFVAGEFGMQIVQTDGRLFGEKVFLTGPITIPSDQVLRFLNRLLEQRGFTLTRGAEGVYLVQPLGEVIATEPIEDPFGVTRIIPTPGLRPSTLAPALAVIGVGTGAVTPGGQAGGGRAAGTTVAYLDDLGVILMTGSPRQIQTVQSLVNRLLTEQASIGFQRFELDNVAASYARDRVLELIGVQRQPAPPQPRAANVQGNVQQASIPAAGDSFLNIEARLTVDPQSNSLIFRGRPDEASELTRLLSIVDAPNTLTSKWYAVGRAATPVAYEGQRRALGDVSVEQGNFQAANQATRFQVPGFQQQGAALVGAGFVVFPDVGGFVYRGTMAQHQQVERMIADLGELTSAEHVVVEFYKLRHSDSVEVAEIISNLLNNQLPTATSPLLGRDLTRSAVSQRTPPPTPPPGQLDAEGQPVEGAATAAATGEIGAITASEDTFVLADEANNQVVVKAPKRLQPQFARLIERLDLRRPQVYIDAKIVAVTTTDEFRLAFETQIMAGQFNLSTNFGLNDGFEGDTFTGRREVSTILPNFTAALIRSDAVPLIIHALQENTDLRILSTPQLLVDDNEEATVASVERQPFSQIIQPDSGPPITSQGGEATAGTTLTVTPQISEGGYLRLAYEIELSSFLGDPTSAGLSPPSQENSISSASVTIPSDTTIIVGGLTVDTQSRTVLKVPLLGDIPLVGHLFRDQGKSNRKTTLYVFITPTIMREPNFADLRLLTKGPAAEAGILDELPHRGPVRIDILSRASRPVIPTMPAPDTAPEPQRAPGPGPMPEPDTDQIDRWRSPSAPSRSSSAGTPPAGRRSAGSPG